MYGTVCWLGLRTLLYRIKTTLMTTPRRPKRKRAKEDNGEADQDGTVLTTPEETKHKSAKNKKTKLDEKAAKQALDKAKEEKEKAETALKEAKALYNAVPSVKKR